MPLRHGSAAPPFVLVDYIITSLSVLHSATAAMLPNMVATVVMSVAIVTIQQQAATILDEGSLIIMDYLVVLM